MEPLLPSTLSSMLDGLVRVSSGAFTQEAGIRSATQSSVQRHLRVIIVVVIMGPPRGRFLYKKVWSIFRLSEWRLSRSLWTNKQYPTPVMAMCRKGTMHQNTVKSVLLFPCPLESLRDFHSRTKAKTLSSVCNVPKDMTNIGIVLEIRKKTLPLRRMTQ